MRTTGPSSAASYELRLRAAEQAVEASQRREADIEHEAIEIDIEAEALEALAAIKRTLAGEVVPSDLDAARRALTRVFEAFVLHIHPSLPDEIHAMPSLPRGVDWWIEPRPRPEAIEIVSISISATGSAEPLRRVYAEQFRRVPLGAKKVPQTQEDQFGPLSKATTRPRSSCARGGSPRR